MPLFRCCPVMSRVWLDQPSPLTHQLRFGDELMLCFLRLLPTLE